MVSLLSGDVDPAIASGDTAQSVTTSASTPDSRDVLQPAVSTYLYNLCVAPSGTLYTVRIEPFADRGAALLAVLQIR